MVDQTTPSAALPVAITSGEPAGIGPELVLMLAAYNQLPSNCVVIGDRDLLAARAEALGLAVTLMACQPEDPVPVRMIVSLKPDEEERLGNFVLGNSDNMIASIIPFESSRQREDILEVIRSSK